MQESTLLPAYLAGASRPDRPAASLRPATAPVASVFLPKEHGSWSLALEPVALALLLAPSAPGFALAAAAFAGFLSRRPWKAALAPRHSEKRREGREALVLLTTLVVAGGFEVLVLGEGTALWPLLLAAPAGALFAHFDAQGEGRAAAAELAGSAAFAILPAVFATLAGWPAAPALALAVLALARSLPAVLTVRTFLRLRKGEAAGVAMPLAVAGAALLAVGGLSAGLGWSQAVTAAAAVLFLRTAWLVGPWRPAWSARRTGMVEAGIGVIYVLFLAACGPGQIPWN